MKKYLIILIFFFGIGVINADIYGANLAAWWRDDNSDVSSLISQDNAGNGNQGTSLTDAGTLAVLSPCKLSQCYSFSKANKNYVRYIRGIAMEGNIDVTVVGWIKTTEAGTNIFFTKGSYSGNYHYQFMMRVTDNFLSVDVFPTDNTNSDRSIVTDNTTKINDGIWHQVGFTFKRSTYIKLWVDGKNVFSSLPSIPSTLNVNTAYGGTICSDNNQTFVKNFCTAQLDDFRIYTRALSDAEILQYYSSTNYNFQRRQL